MFKHFLKHLVMAFIFLIELSKNFSIKPHNRIIQDHLKGLLNDKQKQLNSSRVIFEGKWESFSQKPMDFFNLQKGNMIS